MVLNCYDGGVRGQKNRNVMVAAVPSGLTMAAMVDIN